MGLTLFISSARLVSEEEVVGSSVCEGVGEKMGLGGGG